MCAPRILLLGLSVVLSACAGGQTAPLQRYALGMGRAEYRDYTGARVNLCDTESRWLADELSSVNGLLARFLSSTEEATHPQALHHAQQLALLQEASQSLAPVMEIHRHNLVALRKCDFQRTGAFPNIAQRGTELLELAQARLAALPDVLAANELLKAQRTWAEEAPAREASARQTWCAAHPKLGNADLYFARQYPNGRTEWLFCDGLMVEQPAGGEPQLITPESFSRQERRRIQSQRYLDAARNYPESDIDRQPGAVPGLGTASEEKASRAD